MAFVVDLPGGVQKRVTQSDLNQSLFEDLSRVKDGLKIVLSKSLPNIVYESIPLSGKMIRTKLGILMFKRTFGELKNEHVTALAALELVHLASLLHDDVIDNSEMRRGKTAMNKIFGNTAAVAVGDIILVLAFQMVETLNITTLRKAFFDAIKRMSDAELLEQLNKGSTVPKEVYFEVIRGKSGALFGLASYMASIFEGNPRKEDYELGEKLGMLYQMADDILDFERPEKVGKTTLLDVKNGIPSFPIIMALEENKSLTAFLQDGKWEIILNFIKENEILKKAKEILLEMLRQFVRENPWLKGYVENIFGKEVLP